MDDEDMTTVPDSRPTLVTYHRCLYDIATIMPQLQDDLSESHTLFAKYEHVIRYDAQMRTLVSKHIPSCLRSNTLESSWPQYIPWARHCLTISSAHKIIMIHRKFLWSSFTNPAFTFTRKTCIAAAKTIIREHKQVIKEDGPVLWIYHAFSVAASVRANIKILRAQIWNWWFLDHTVSGSFLWATSRIQSTRSSRTSPGYNWDLITLRNKHDCSPRGQDTKKIITIRAGAGKDIISFGHTHSCAIFLSAGGFCRSFWELATNRNVIRYGRSITNGRIAIFWRFV